MTMALNFSTDMSEAPDDKFILLKVCSGMSTTRFDYVMCRRHSDGYKSGEWVTAQNDRLTDSHTGEVFGWIEISDLDIDTEIADNW
jgi:hypothetical protein